MVSLVFLFIVGVFTIYIAKPKSEELSPIPRKLSDRMTSLWEIAHKGMRDDKLLGAEKALLTILNIDERNAAAYNRLGILYAKQKEYKDAIDCFEIASSIEPSPSSLHNLGLIYYETEHYEKAATAFEQALKLEDTFAARHIAYAKANEKLGRYGQMVKSLEKAVEIEVSKESLTLLMHAYILVGEDEKAKTIQLKIDSYSKPVKKKTNKLLPKKVRRPRRIVH